MLKVRVGYPSAADEKAVLLAQRSLHPLESLKSVVSGDDVLKIQAAVRDVRIEDSVLEYLLALVRATRSSKRLTVGASPRGALYLSRAAQAHALLGGRDFVLPDDVKTLAVPVLAHRVIGPSGFGGGGDGAKDEREHVIAEILDTLEVPV